MRKGQGAFEYILMLAGILLIVILIVLILQGNVAGQNNALGTQINKFGNLTTASNIYPDTTSGILVRSITGNLTGAGVTTGSVLPCWSRTGPGQACPVKCPANAINNVTGVCL